MVMIVNIVHLCDMRGCARPATVKVLRTDLSDAGTFCLVHGERAASIARQREWAVSESHLRVVT